MLKYVEPISNSLEQDAHGRELYEAEKVFRVVLPPNEQPALPLHPREEAFDDPTARVSAERSSVLRLELLAIPAVRRDEIDTFSRELLVERIAVVGTIADEILRLRLEHVEVEAQLHQRDFMMIRSVRAHRKRQAVAVDNRQYFHAFAALRRPDLVAAALGKRERRIDEALALVDHTFVAELVRQARQHLTQNLLPAPLLKPAMNRLVVRKALRKHVPLRARVQDPEHSVQDLARRHGLATRSVGRVRLLRKMLPDSFPVRIAQPLHGIDCRGLDAALQRF